MNRRVSLVLGRNAPGFPSLSPNPVENSVESVENFPPLHVPMVENLWKTPWKHETPLRKTFAPATFRQENCCTSPWKMLQINWYIFN